MPYFLNKMFLAKSTQYKSLKAYMCSYNKSRLAMIYSCYKEPYTLNIQTRYVAASAVTDRYTHKPSTVTLRLMCRGLTIAFLLTVGPLGLVLRVWFPFAPYASLLCSNSGDHTAAEYGKRYKNLCLGFPLRLSTLALVPYKHMDDFLNRPAHYIALCTTCKIYFTDLFMW